MNARWLTCTTLALLWCSTDCLAEDVDYNRDIRPILSDHCFACHGPDATHREADLRLDIEESAKESAIRPGHPEKSELVARITSNDPEQIMPPKDGGKPLSPQEIEQLTRWIQAGADYAPFWAYQPPQSFPEPRVQLVSWPMNWIDRFLLARWEKEGLAPAPDAEKVTLLRRITFDLTGLPPTPAEVDDFLADDSASAYEQVVDRLLASDRFGERMAIYWLDLVRYADTVGYHGDQDHNISPYRDYVIDAFNDNLPFDQFTREQLAGDLLPNATTDQIIATGYNRLLQTSHEGGVQPKEYLAIYGADRVRNVSAVWMGATMGCAQCHNHKYDPYTMRDFYSLQAFFADVDEAQHFKVGGNSLPTNRPPEIEVLSKRDRTQLATLQQQLEQIKTAQTEAAPDQIAELESRIQAIEARRRKTMITVAIEPREIRILPRGNWLDDSGDIVHPAVPQFLGELDTQGARATRLDLANWLVDPEQGIGGLTARVFVNRLWALFFGNGIVGSLDDFGGQGETPVHPELLDRLALEFVEAGWDVKQIIKQIVMSHAYRQSSRVSETLLQQDPDNRLFARQSRFRLPAEMIRDNALAISGLLVLDYGGASIKPYQPAGYYRHLNFPKRKYFFHEDSRQWRRGVYMHWQRQFLHPMLKAFDAPSREECTAQRPRSNTPLAALTLLNDPTFIEAARVFAERILREGGTSDTLRLDYAFRRAVSRTPDEYERNTLLVLLEQTKQDYREHPEEARLLTAVGIAPRADDLPESDLAAWTAVARAILNLSEVITRN